MEVASFSSTADEFDLNQQSLKFTSSRKSVSPFNYYQFTSWQNHLSQFNDILAKQNPLSLLIGANGSGKSTLLSKFLSELPASFHVHRIEGDIKLKLEDLVAVLKQVFKAPPSDDIVTLEQIDQLVYQFLSRQKNYFLIMDDAHKIPIETLEGLLRIANNAKESGLSLQVLISGDVYLQRRLENLLAKLGRDKDIPVFEIHPLTLEESKDYLDFWVIKMDVDRQLFSEQMVQRIYNLSGGFPGRINRIAQQVLRDHAKFELQFTNYEDKKEPQQLRLSYDYRKFGLFVVVLLTLLVSYLIYQNSQDSIKPGSRILVHKSSKHITKSIPRRVAPREDGFAYVASIENLPVENLKAQAAPIKDTLSQIENHLHSPQPNVRETTSPRPVAQKERITNPTMMPVKKNHMPFTIQLVAGRHRAALDQYRNLPAMKGKTQIIHSILNGKDWYVLVFGEYKNREQAKLALHEIPPLFKTQKPWIRSLAALSNK